MRKSFAILLITLLLITPVFVCATEETEKKPDVVLETVQPSEELKEDPEFADENVGKANAAEPGKIQAEEAPKPAPELKPEPMPETIPGAPQEVQSVSVSHAPIYIAAGALVVALGVILVIRNKRRKK